MIASPVLKFSNAWAVSLAMAWNNCSRGHEGNRQERTRVGAHGRSAVWNHCNQARLSLRSTWIVWKRRLRMSGFSSLFAVRCAACGSVWISTTGCKVWVEETVLLVRGLHSLTYLKMKRHSKVAWSSGELRNHSCSHPPPSPTRAKNFSQLQATLDFGTNRSMKG